MKGGLKARPIHPGGAIFPPLLGLLAKATGSVAMGYIVPLGGFVAVAIYGFFTPRTQTV